MVLVLLVILKEGVMRDLERYRLFIFEVIVLLRHESTISFLFHESSISGTEEGKIIKYEIPRTQLLQMDADNSRRRYQDNDPSLWSENDTPEKTFSVWLRLNKVWHGYILQGVKLLRGA